MQITLDAGVLTLVLWLPCAILVGPILSNWTPLNPFFLGIFVAGFAGYRLSKLDPAGKTLVAFLFDLTKYLVRSLKGSQRLGPETEPERAAGAGFVAGEGRAGCGRPGREPAGAGQGNTAGVAGIGACPDEKSPSDGVAPGEAT